MSSLGEAVLDLLSDDSMLMKGIAGAKSKALNALGGLSDIGGTIVKAGMVAAVAGTAVLVKGLYDSVQAAVDAEVVQAQLNAVLESTQGIAGVTADEVNNLATSLSEMTMFDDEAIVSAESMLLTFTNIGKNVFPEATKTVLDMSQALGQDLQTSSIQLGKALNDPIAGVTALQRVGVKFTDEQKNMIEQLVKSGKLEEAQALILKQLQTEFGGSAEAAGKTFAGQLKILQTKLGNVQEMIGAKLLPIILEFVSALSEWASRPEVQAMLEQMATKIAEFAKQAVENIPKVIQTFKDMFAWLQNNQGVIVAVLAVLGAAVAAFAYTTLVPLLPIIAVMALIGAAAYLLYEAWTTNWGGIRDYVAAAWAVIQPVLQTLWDWLKINVPIAIQALSDFFMNTLQPAVKKVFDWISTNVFPLLAKLWDWLKTNIPQALQALAGFWQNVLLPAIKAVWGWLSGTLFPYFQSLANFLGAVLGVALTALAGIWQNVLLPAIQGVWSVISSLLMPIFEKLASFWTNTLQPIAQAIAEWFGTKIKDAFGGLTRTMETVTTWLDKISTKLNNLKLPKWMTPGSPTPWEIGLLGVNDALKKVGNIGLPNISASMGMMAAPAIAGSNMSFSGGGGVQNLQFVYQPMIGVNDEYEAERKLRGIVERINRRTNNQ